MGNVIMQVAVLETIQQWATSQRTRADESGDRRTAAPIIITVQLGAMRILRGHRHGDLNSVLDWSTVADRLCYLTWRRRQWQGTRLLQ